MNLPWESDLARKLLLVATAQTWQTGIRTGWRMTVGERWSAFRFTTN